METVKGTFFKWEQPSSFSDRMRKKVDRERAYREACDAVDERDGGRCRACGAHVPRRLRHHHRRRGAGHLSTRVGWLVVPG